MKAKALVVYDTAMHTVTLKYKKFVYVQLASYMIKEIYRITFFEDGYFIADTNYGEEYFDFQYSLEKRWQKVTANMLKLL